MRNQKENNENSLSRNDLSNEHLAKNILNFEHWLGKIYMAVKIARSTRHYLLEYLGPYRLLVQF